MANADRIPKASGSLRGPHSREPPAAALMFNRDWSGGWSASVNVYPAAGLFFAATIRHVEIVVGCDFAATERLVLKRPKSASSNHSTPRTGRFTIRSRPVSAAPSSSDGASAITPTCGVAAGLSWLQSHQRAGDADPPEFLSRADSAMDCPQENERNGRRPLQRRNNYSFMTLRHALGEVRIGHFRALALVSCVLPCCLFTDGLPLRAFAHYSQIRVWRHLSSRTSSRSPSWSPPRRRSRR
jgi:hypothetical protein